MHTSARKCVHMHATEHVQYYNFIRFGLDGYRRIFSNLFDIYDYLRGRLEQMGG